MPTGKPWKRKYYFDELEMGESIEIEGKYSTIYHSAYNWGVRYGVHLRVTRTASGARITRVDAPTHNRKPKTTATQTERLQKLEDALRFVSILVIRIDKKLTEIQEALK
jgi:hypothetical protein